MTWATRYNLLFAVGLGILCAAGQADPGSNTPLFSSPPSISDSLPAAEPQLAELHAAVEAGDDIEVTIPTLEALTPSEMGPELGEYASPKSAQETFEAAEALIGHFRESGQTENSQYRDQVLAMIVRADVRPPQKTMWLYEHLRRAHSQGENVPLAQLIRVDTGSKDKDHRKKYRTVRLIQASQQMLLKLDDLNQDLPKLGLSQVQFEKEVRHRIVRIFASIAEYFGTPLRNLTRGVKYHLGIQRDLSLAMYTNATTGIRRPLSQKAQEVLINGSILAAFTGIVTYYSNSEKIHLYPAYAALQAGCFQFFWSYFERANSALRTYGMSYRHDLKGFDVNSKMYYFTQFALSLPAALATTWSLHGAVLWSPSLHAIQNAAIGTFARRWISVYIGRHQNSGHSHFHADSSRRHSFRQTFFLNLGATMFVTWLRNSHLAGWDSWMSLGSIYALMAVGDIVWEVKKHFTARIEMPRFRDLLNADSRQQFKTAMGEIWKRFYKKDLSAAANAVGLKPLKSCSNSLYLLSGERYRAIRKEAQATKM